MPRLRVDCFTLSVDGYGAGPEQDRENPLGVGGRELHRWYVSTRTFESLGLVGVATGEDGTTGVDDGYARRGFESVGAWIMGRSMFGPIRALFSQPAIPGTRQEIEREREPLARAKRELTALREALAA